MLECIFNKVESHQAYSFIKKTLQHGCFPVNLRNFEEHLQATAPDEQLADVFFIFLVSKDLYTNLLLILAELKRIN